MTTESESIGPTVTAQGGVKRREFLKVLGAGAAVTTMIGCGSEKVERLIPYLVSPDQTVPGVSTYYATTCRECAAACGVIAETRDGRTIKLEGNPDHPVNRGAMQRFSSPRAQKRQTPHVCRNHAMPMRSPIANRVAPSPS